MRKLWIVVLLCVAPFATGAELFTSLPAMAESDPSQAVSWEATPSAVMVAGTPRTVRRHLAATDEPKIKMAIAVHSIGHSWYYLSCHILTPIPKGSEIVGHVEKPDGTVEMTAEPFVVPYDSDAVQGDLWWGALPEKWKEGMYTFMLTVSIEGKKQTVFAQSPMGMFPVPLVGPLERVEVNSDGSVSLSGNFSTPLVVIAPNYLNAAIQLRGGSVIPSSAGLTGEVVLAVCAGDPLECTTRVVYIGSPRPLLRR